MRLIEDAVIEEPPEQQVEPTSLSPRRRWLLISANVAGWFVVSIFMTIYNKWLFSIFGLKFPLLVTSVHIAIKVPLAAAAMRLLQVPRLHFEPRVLWWQVMPTGFATALDIGLSNLSFLFITVTYYTIVKSSVPLWILVFSICLGLQRPSIWLGGVVVTIIAGITLASIGPADAAAPLVDDNVTLTVEPTGTAAGAAAGAADLVVRRLMQLATAGEEVAAEPEAGEEGAGSDGAAESAGTTLLGLVLVLIASLLGGFRWACTQLLLMSRDPAASRCPTSDVSDASGTGGVEGGVGGEGGEGERIMGAEASPARARRANTPSAPREKLGEEGPGHGGQGLHPLAMVLATSPFGFALLLPIALLLELGPLLQYRAEHPESSTARFFALASAGGIAAFLMLLFELRVVQLASGLTLSIAGVFKEVLTISASVVLLGDQLTPFKVAGLGICVLGIAGYQYLKLVETAPSGPLAAPSTAELATLRRCRHSAGPVAVPEGSINR